MAYLAAAATATQIARSANDIVCALAGAGVAVAAREGVSSSVLGYLAASTAELLPHTILINGLAVSHALEGRWNSPFMANFMGVRQGTTQQALLSEDIGKKLVVYTTALAAATTQSTVRGILREHLAVTLGLQQVAEVPQNIYHVCVHPPTLRLLQDDIASNFERCAVAFSSATTGNSRVASYRELAIIAIAFATAQKKGPAHWVRVKNLIGAEALCAALSTAFLADVTIGSIKTVISRAPRVSTCPPIRNADSTSVVGRNQPAAQHNSSNESALSTTTPTSIHFEYDTSGEVTIGICEAGAPVRDYVVPEGGPGRPSRNSMLGGEVLALARIVLGHDSSLPWVCRSALGAYSMRRLAMEIVEELRKYQNGAFQAMTANLIGKWMDVFVRESGGTEENNKMMQDMLVKAAIPDVGSERFVREVELLAGPDHAEIVSQKLKNTDVCKAIDRVLAVSLLKVLFGLSYTGLELNLDALDYFHYPAYLEALIPHLFDVLPAYNVPVTTYRTFSRCCSVVQCGGYALMPRILAEEEIGDIDGSPFIMVPGRLAKDGVPINGFFYNEQHGETHMDAIRPEAPVPSNAGDSNVIDYVYEETDYGYKFQTVEAGHRLNLDGLINGILLMHRVDDSYGDQAAISYWQRAAPHHMVLHANSKAVYLAYGNVAGRRLALSRAGDAKCFSAVHTGKDYRRALAYANQHGCGAVIL
jgi:hypothetical protein